MDRPSGKPCASVIVRTLVSDDVVVHEASLSVTPTRTSGHIDNAKNGVEGWKLILRIIVLKNWTAGLRNTQNFGDIIVHVVVCLKAMMVVVIFCVYISQCSLTSSHTVLFRNSEVFIAISHPSSVSLWPLFLLGLSTPQTSLSRDLFFSSFHPFVSWKPRNSLS